MPAVRVATAPVTAQAASVSTNRSAAVPGSRSPDTAQVVLTGGDLPLRGWLVAADSLVARPARPALERSRPAAPAQRGRTCTCPGRHRPRRFHVTTRNAQGTWRPDDGISCRRLTP